MKSTCDLMDQTGLEVDVIVFNVTQWPKDQIGPPTLFGLVCPV